MMATTLIYPNVFKTVAGVIAMYAMSYRLPARRRLIVSIELVRLREEKTTLIYSLWGEGKT